MLNTIKNLLAQKKPKSETFRAAIAEIDIPALSAAVAALAAERRSMLLTADDAAIEKVEQRKAKAERDLDRAVAALQEIETRLDAALAQESEDAKRAEYAQINAAARALRDRYPAAAREIVALIEAVDAADRAVKEWNEDSIKRQMFGEAEQYGLGLIEHVEPRIFENFGELGLTAMFAGVVRLPNTARDFAPGVHHHDMLWAGADAKFRVRR